MIYYNFTSFLGLYEHGDIYVKTVEGLVVNVLFYFETIQLNI